MRESPFFLSHHRPGEHHRCVAIGGLRVCARCLGVYPVLFVLLAAQIAGRAPMTSSLDLAVGFLVPLPALLDWARGRFNPRSGSNGLRFLTGFLLGVSLSRTLYLHLRSPGHPLAMAQFASLALAALLVEVISRHYRLRAGRDPKAAPHVEGGDRNRSTSSPGGE